MAEYIVNNIGTVIIGFCLLAVVLLIIRKMIADAKKGGCTSCDGCPGCKTKGD